VNRVAAPTPSEPLQPQDLVITLLGTYVRPVEIRTVWSGGVVSLLGELGFSQGAARVALTRLVRRGLIARERSGRLVHYRVTERCDRLLAEGDGRIFALGDPREDQGTWTVLWHQIPEDRRLERSRLARRLRFLGFGSVQDSVWVSPHDHAAEVGELLTELGVAEFTAMFMGRVGPSAGIAALVSRAWDLSGLVERYDGFVREFQPLRGRKRIGDREAFIVRTRLVHLFRGFPSLDPELPAELSAPWASSAGTGAQSADAKSIRKTAPASTARRSGSRSRSAAALRSAADASPGALRSAADAGPGALRSAADANPGALRSTTDASDPAPAELAPLSRSRARAVEVFHDLYEKLAVPSQRYFVAATADPALRVGRASGGRR
jgi:phenylacetic acid degradation operon negative regulatory protein